MRWTNDKFNSEGRLGNGADTRWIGGGVDIGAREALVFLDDPSRRAVFLRKRLSFGEGQGFCRSDQAL